MSAELLPMVRGFVRDVNLAIKLVALYGLGHKQSATPLDASWNELRSVLNEEKKLLITASGERLHFNGSPLQAGSADRSLAHLLGTAGIGGLTFLEALTRDEFTIFASVVAATKAPELCAELKRQLGPKSNVRVMEFRLVGEEGERATGMSVASQLTASVLGLDSNVSAGTPSDILRVLSALPQAGIPMAPMASQDGAALQAGETEATQAIRWLAHLSSRGKNEEQAGSGLTDTSAAVLRDAAASLAHTDLDSEQPALVALAEQLAVRVALDKFKRGEIPFDAVHQMLNRLKKEVESLHKILGEQEDTMARAGIEFESPSDVLERQFWAAIPERNKLQVLQSADAWCIPAKNISAFLDGLLEAGDSVTAEKILRHYCSLVRGADTEAREKLLRGIAEMAEVFARVSPRLLQWVVGFAGKQLSAELPPEQRPAIVVSFGCVVRQAVATRNHAAVANALEDVRELESVSRGFAEQVRAETRVEIEVAGLLSAALQTTPVAPELIYILRQMPQAVSGEIVSRFAHCTHRYESDRLLAVAVELGSSVIECLRHNLQTATAPQAILSVGLLTVLDAESIEGLLRRRLPEWTLPEHAVVVHQVACSGAPQRGVLLSHLLDVLHPLIAPQALDEIGTSKAADMNTLTSLAQNHGLAAHTQFLKLKILEAMGNLQDASTVPLLASIVLAKARWTWQYPRELRVVALQALFAIDPLSAQKVLTESGFGKEELSLTPLPPKPGEWVRSRRYQRIPFEKLWASIHHPGGSFTVSVESLSLGGGAGRTTSRAQNATEGELEIAVGLRKLRASVLLYPTAYKMAFEIAAISLEDRARLRQLLTSRMRAK